MNLPSVAVWWLLPWFNIVFGAGNAPSKKAFCRFYSECRATAQMEFENCADGIVHAIVAKGEEIGGGNALESGEARKKCTSEMDPTVGRSMRTLYTRLERKALKCADEMAHSQAREFNEQELLQCKATHMDLAIQRFPSPFALLSLQETAQSGNGAECAQAYRAQLNRCQALRMCCPELDKCMTSVEIESNIRTKEDRVRSLFDKCMNEAMLKSAEVLFVNTTAKTTVDENADPVPVPIVADATPSTPAAPREIRRKPSAQKWRTNENTSDSGTINNTTTLLPPPDPSLRNLLDFIFPGLDINRRRPIGDRSSGEPTTTTMTKETVTTTTTPVQEAEAAEKSKIGSFLMESGTRTNEDTAMETKKEIRTAKALPPLFVLAIGSIFCERYKECAEVTDKLRAKVPMECNGETEEDGVDGVAGDWFTFERMHKCMSVKSMHSLWALLEEEQQKSKHCPRIEQFHNECMALRQCCPRLF